MSEMLDRLLKPEVANVQKDLPTGKYKVKRLSKAVGEDVIFTLRALPYGRVQDIKGMAEDSEVAILLVGCVDPDLKDKALMEKFGGPTPAETVKGLLLPGEIEDMSRAVERLSGYRAETIEEVKNGSGTAATAS